MSIHEKEQRIRAYKSDKTLEMFRQIIVSLRCIAKPVIKVCVDDPSKSIFDIDEDSRVVIKYWQQRMEEYILTQYPDIIEITMP